MAHTQSIYWPYHFPQYPESDGLMDQWDDFLKIKLKSQTNIYTSLIWDNILYKAVYTLNKHLTCDTFYPIAKIHKSKNQGVEIRLVYTIASRPQNINFSFPELYNLLTWTFYFQMGQVSPRRSNNDSIKLEAKNSAWSFWAFRILVSAS